VLKPTIFPSVPRLYNRIYSVFNSKIREAGCLKQWLVKQGLKAKLNTLHSGQAVYTSSWDFALKMFRDSIGGQVRWMVTAAVTID
jgi:long-chain acyl-CoA synthetase